MGITLLLLLAACQTVGQAGGSVNANFIVRDNANQPVKSGELVVSKQSFPIKNARARAQGVAFGRQKVEVFIDGQKASKVGTRPGINNPYVMIAPGQQSQMFSLYVERPAQVQAPAGCQSDNDCKLGEICKGGQCVPGCYQDYDCPMNAPFCVNGQCAAAQPGCQSNRDCSQPTPVCDTQSGNCVECVAADECGGGEQCINNQCQLPLGGCNTDADCGPQETCDSQTYTCVSAAVQCADTDAANDVHVKGTVTVPGRTYEDICIWNGNSVRQSYCDASGQVQYQDTGCPNGCVDGICKECNTDADCQANCPVGATCSCQNNMCAAIGAGAGPASCQDNADCPSGEYCKNNVCEQLPSGVECRKDADCPTGDWCEFEACVPEPDTPINVYRGIGPRGDEHGKKTYVHECPAGEHAFGIAQYVYDDSVGHYSYRSSGGGGVPIGSPPSVREPTLAFGLLCTTGGQTIPSANTAVQWYPYAQPFVSNNVPNIKPWPGTPSMVNPQTGRLWGQIEWVCPQGSVVVGATYYDSAQVGPYEDVMTGVGIKCRDTQTGQVTEQNWYDYNEQCDVTMGASCPPKQFNVLTCPAGEAVSKLYNHVGPNVPSRYMTSTFNMHVTDGIGFGCQAI